MFAEIVAVERRVPPFLRGSFCIRIDCLKSFGYLGGKCVVALGHAGRDLIILLFLFPAVYVFVAALRAEGGAP